MNVRVLICTAVLVGNLSALPCELRGDEPSDAAWQQIQWQDVAKPLNLQKWSVTTFTYGNPLGVEVTSADAALRAQLGLEKESGVVVTSVRSDSEAEKSGLRSHDLILKIGQAAIESPEQFNKAVTEAQGQDAEFHIMRQGKRATLPVAVPKPLVYDWVAAPKFVTDRQADAERYRIGVVLAEVDDTLRSQLRLNANEGLVVTKVLPDSPAAETGLREHDILIELDGKRLTTVEELNEQVQEIKDREVGVTFLRGGRVTDLELTPQLRKEPTDVAYSFLFNEGTNLLSQQQPLVFNQQPLTFDQQPTFQWSVGFERNSADGHSQAASAASPLDQIAALRRQLAQMQQSLSALEAALQRDDQDPPGEEPKEQE